MYKTIDLFAGIGGIRRGFERMGHFENVLSAEIDKYACLTYEHLFQTNPYNDVTSPEFKRKVADTQYDVLLGGFPCQAFSIAGKKEGFKDKTRGTLFYDIADIIEATRPKAFLLENVEGLIRHQRGETFRVIIETLCEELNYKVIGVERNQLTGELEYDPRSFILNSRHFGLPQNRPRVYIMGFDATYYGELTERLLDVSLPQYRVAPPIYRNLHDVLEYGAEPEFYLSTGYLHTLKKHRARHEGKGNGYGYIVVNAPDIAEPISNALLATGGSGKERNLVFDPQEGIAGLKLRMKQTPLNSEGIRHMKPSEWGKLQGFIGYAFVNEVTGEDEFSFPAGVSNAQRYKQFGNAVSIPVIEVLADKMYGILQELDRNKALQNTSSETIISA